MSAWTVDEPGTRRERVRGARDLHWLTSTHGMLFRRCRSVHTFGMREPIIVAALDARMRVVHVRIVQPRRAWLPRPGVRHVLEARADADVERGDRFVRTDEARPERRRGEGPTTLRPTRR